MLEHEDPPLTSADDFYADPFWIVLYALLSPRMRNWVYGAHIAAWNGQEIDMADDIVQTAMLKIFEELLRGRMHIRSVQARSLVIAYHCFIDAVRRDVRRVVISYDHLETEGFQHMLPVLLVDPGQEMEERLYEEEVLYASVQTITAFSRKLRQAILVDLANCSCFDGESSTLQQAFLASGIRLQDYQRAPSPDPAERRRQSALRSLGYKRLAQIDVE
jgi:DNA-directed RNA polymerase specialized sigma24 family protein